MNENNRCCYYPICSVEIAGTLDVMYNTWWNRIRLKQDRILPTGGIESPFAHLYANSEIPTEGGSNYYG